MDQKTQLHDSGRLSGTDNMAIDRHNLEDCNSGRDERSKIRFFQWNKKTISYGYLLNAEKVSEWGQAYGNPDMVKRPTGGGAVLHEDNDLSFSLLWPRGRNILPEKPRENYATIHEILVPALEEHFQQSSSLSLCQRTPNQALSLLQTSRENTANKERFSVCFDEPVCNDIMIGEKKVLGGALRMTRKGILYQGNILLKDNRDLSILKTKLADLLIAGLALYIRHPGEGRGPGLNLI